MFSSDKRRWHEIFILWEYQFVCHVSLLVVDRFIYIYIHNLTYTHVSGDLLRSCDQFDSCSSLFVIVDHQVCLGSMHKSICASPPPPPFCLFLFSIAHMCTWTPLVSPKRRHLLFSPFSCAGILEQSLGARNRAGIGLSYTRPARLHRLAASISWNRFLGSLNV